MFPGLEARSHVCQRRGGASKKRIPTFFIVFLRRLIYDCTVFQTSKVEHSYAAVGATAHEHVNAVSAETNVEDLFIVSYQLRLGRQRWYIPYCASGVDARSDDQTRRKCIPIQ